MFPPITNSEEDLRRGEGAGGEEEWREKGKKREGRRERNEGREREWKEGRKDGGVRKTNKKRKRNCIK